jgi:tRNA1(Val) A37 N6-methylase TrmN6
MRNQGRLRLGYFPLPLSEARRIRACLRYPTSPVSTIDPCIGDGAAFLAITAETCSRRYGIELDAYRAEQAASVADELIHGDCLDVHCPVESFGLAFLNPPYDWTIGEGRNERTERVFLAHAYSWLKAGGVLVLVVPAQHVCDCGEILASRFKETRIFRLTDPEAIRYRQVVVLATRRTRREREQLKDDDIIARRAQFADIGRNYERLAALGYTSTPLYTVPDSGPPKLEYRGPPLDEIEDLLPRSSAYRQAARILFPSPAAFKGRPLTPLHSGHVALCAVSGMLNGVFGSGKDLHVAAWQAVKVVDRSEEVEENGTIVQRQRERFTNELTLVFASGETAILR